MLAEEWKDGVKKITLVNGAYKASVLTRGAILQSFSVNGRDVVTGFDSLEGYMSQTCYMGEVVGPFANRIKDATFIQDGEVYRLEKNNGENSLHSGSKNFGAQDFQIAGYSASSVTLSLISGPAGGFDQTHEVLVSYFLSEEGALTIDYQVSSDKKCPVNITNHVYFNLGGGDIRKTRIMIPARKYLEVDSSLIPIGERETVGTDFDFTSFHEIGERRGGAYDHCMILEEGKALVCEKDGLRLSMLTDLPAVQLYTGEYLASSEKGKHGSTYSAFEGFALESENYPDFVNRPEFPGAWTLPGGIYRSTTTYILEEI